MSSDMKRNDPAVILSELSYILMKLCHGNKQEKKEARGMLKELNPLIEKSVNEKAYQVAVERLDYTNEELMHIERVAI